MMLCNSTNLRVMAGTTTSNVASCSTTFIDVLSPSLCTAITVSSVGLFDQTRIVKAQPENEPTCFRQAGPSLFLSMVESIRKIIKNNNGHIPSKKKKKIVTSRIKLGFTIAYSTHLIQVYFGLDLNMNFIYRIILPHIRYD